MKRIIFAAIAAYLLTFSAAPAVAQTPPAPKILDLDDATKTFTVLITLKPGDAAPTSSEIGCGATSGNYSIAATVPYPGGQIQATKVINLSGDYFCAARSVNAIGKSVYSAEIFIRAGKKSPVPDALQFSRKPGYLILIFHKPVEDEPVLYIWRYGRERGIMTAAYTTKEQRVVFRRFLPQGFSWGCLSAKYVDRESTCIGEARLRRRGSDIRRVG